MIDGFKLTVKSDELIRHLEHRAVHHAQQVTDYEIQIAHLAIAPIEIRKIQERHEAKAAWFKFAAEHVEQGEEFLLSFDELARLEIVPRLDVW